MVFRKIQILSIIIVPYQEISNICVGKKVKCIKKNIVKRSFERRKKEKKEKKGKKGKNILFLKKRI